MASNQDVRLPPPERSTGQARATSSEPHLTETHLEQGRGRHLHEHETKVTPEQPGEEEE